MIGAKLALAGTIFPIAQILNTTSPALSVWEKYGIAGVFILFIVILYTDAKASQKRFEILLSEYNTLAAQIRDELRVCHNKD